MRSSTRDGVAGDLRCHDALLAIFAATTALLAIFEALTALFLIFGVVTALFLSCDVPTLFAASWLTAATLVPPSATSREIEATTIAGDGRCLRRNLTDEHPFCGRVDPWYRPGGKLLLPTRGLAPLAEDGDEERAVDGRSNGGRA